VPPAFSSAAAGPLEIRNRIMGTTCSCDLIFRPAFPDEENRAKYVEGDRSPVGRSEWFLALTQGPVERIVGTIRYGRSTPSANSARGVDFRMTGGPGGELAGKEQAFLEAFTRHCEGSFRGRLRHMPLIRDDHPWNEAFAKAGFEIRYREYHLVAPVEALAARVERSHQALQRHPSPLSAGKIVPVRECAPEAAIALIATNDLMDEAAVRAIWQSEDRGQLDRAASSCFILGGEMLGVVLAADAGRDLKIMAIAVREDVPGARLWVTPHLMHHLFQATARHHYQQAFFRANAETAPTTFNFATRAGGKVVADLRRWVKEIG
jgi:hypothetical protein